MVDKVASPGKERRNASARRNASSLAQASHKKRASTSQTPREFVKESRASLQFKMLAIQGQLELLDSLASMSTEDKADALFDLLSLFDLLDDGDGDEYVDAQALGRGLRKIDGTVGFKENVDRAVAVADADGNAKLDRKEFGKLLDDLTKSIGCDFRELSEMIVLGMDSGDDGEEGLPMDPVVEKAVTKEVNDEVPAADAFSKVLIDDRMVALFKLFDADGDGSISFSEVAVGLYKMTDDMDASARNAISALLLFDEDDSRTLDYSQFARLILNMIAASGVTFDDVADSMTLAQCRDLEMTPDELDTLMVADIMFNAEKELEQAASDLADVVDALEYGRMHRLFKLWDLDGDGSIDFGELVLGMRKFQDAREKDGMDQTVEEGIIAMLEFDSNDDQKLDMAEFALFLVKYAQKSGTELHELIDFMVVTSALADNDAAEKAYIESINSDATRKIRAVEREMRKNDPVRRAERQIFSMFLVVNMLWWAFVAAVGYFVYKAFFASSPEPEL